MVYNLVCNAKNLICSHIVISQTMRSCVYSMAFMTFNNPFMLSSPSLKLHLQLGSNAEIVCFYL